MPDTTTNTPASPSFEKLKLKLRELFELDKADLDFGIYRILRQRHTEITEFLDKHLEKTVREALTSHGQLQQAGIEEDLQKAESAARTAGIAPEQSPRVMELREKYGKGADLDATADEVYSHLFTFFSRYYLGGDFIGLHRSTVQGREKYMIPYNGEEVKLVWANMDQYYIKSSELLRDYVFHIAPGAGTLLEAAATERCTVHFNLVEADTEKDNRKPSGKTTRAFSLYDKAPFSADGPNTLSIQFHYSEHTPKARQSASALQDELNADTEKTLFDNLPTRWKAILFSPDPTYQGKDRRDTRSILQKHLRTYTAKHQFDYFIHKDLGGFLRRELDFYIKNEVMHLDDIESAGSAKAEEYLSKIRAIRLCATPVIQMLTQLEEFQKKLWLKKKFVVETRYCLTLDLVPEVLYEEVCANEDQWREWEDLYKISELTPQRTRNFLKANLYLVLDTRHYDSLFTIKLLASIENLDAMLNGICFHSENFQALQLVKERYREQVKCVYIDPPYNTDNDINFPYKDSFARSSWLACIQQGATLAFHLLAEDALYFLQIGDTERAASQLVLEAVSATRKNTVSVRRGVKNVQAQFDDIEKLNFGHDVIHVFGRSRNSRIPHLRQSLAAEKPGKWDTFWRGTDRGTMRYELFGKNPESGQWRWEEERAKGAAQNYEEYITVEAKNKTLDEWYIENLQAGRDLDFVRKNEDGVVQYYVPPQGFRLLSDNWLDIPSAGNFTDFPHEKAMPLLERIIGWKNDKEILALDYFGGSGTTGHAVINLNRKDGGKRKYLLVEMGEHFHATLVPRLKKASYSTDWKDSKPQTRNTGTSHAFKIVRLEGYEDTLNNLSLRRVPDQEAALAKADELTRDQYLLSYFLDVESAGSKSLLNLGEFRDPFAYKMNIATSSAGETKETNVDLVETFNWLLGLKVKHIDSQRGFVTVTGEKRVSGRTLIIWRTLSSDPVADNTNLEKFLGKLAVNPADTEYEFIYVNGSHTLNDPHNKVHLIEETFQRLMFDSTSFESLS